MVSHQGIEPCTVGLKARSIAIDGCGPNGALRRIRTANRLHTKQVPFQLAIRARAGTRNRTEQVELTRPKRAQRYRQSQTRDSNPASRPYERQPHPVRPADGAPDRN